MDENFLLTNSVAQTLYHDYSEKMPIIDYHCHINPKEIFEDKKFKNITQVWLYGDHRRGIADCFLCTVSGYWYNLCGQIYEPSR